MASLRNTLALVAAFCASQAAASCAHGTNLFRRGLDGHAEPGSEPGHANFAYSGELGPENWHTLSPANAVCATGRNQSPIDMVPTSFKVISGSSLNIKLPNMSNGTTLNNLGTTIEATAQPGASINVGGSEYALRQFHFHLPSEHLDDGVSMAMEMHMVFENPEDKLAVIGTYISVDGAAGAAPSKPGKPEKRHLRFDRRKAAEEKYTRAADAAAKAGCDTSKIEATASPLLETVFSEVESIQSNGDRTLTAALDMSEVAKLLSAGSFQTYSGSLTTPPCTEGVTWLVSTQKLSIKSATFASVRDLIGNTARPTQNAPGQPNVLEGIVGGNSTRQQ